MPRHRDRELLRRLHLEWRSCAVCGETWPLSLHHIYDRHDVRENLVMLCGDGVTGCHGKITCEHKDTRWKLGAYLLRSRPDVLEYINAHQGGEAWLDRRLFVTT